MAALFGVWGEEKVRTFLDADLAVKNRLPSMSTQGQWVEAGGLMSYGPSFPDLYRHDAPRREGGE